MQCVDSVSAGYRRALVTVRRHAIGAQSLDRNKPERRQGRPAFSPDLSSTPHVATPQYLLKVGGGILIAAAQMGYRIKPILSA
jgi:hypothetical protein